MNKKVGKKSLFFFLCYIPYLSLQKYLYSDDGYDCGAYFPRFLLDRVYTRMQRKDFFNGEGGNTNFQKIQMKILKNPTVKY